MTPTSFPACGRKTNHRPGGVILNVDHPGKIQLLNCNWHFFYAGRLLNLQCSPRTKHPVSREQAATQCAHLIETFVRETDRRMLRNLE